MKRTAEHAQTNSVIQAELFRPRTSERSDIIRPLENGRLTLVSQIGELPLVLVPRTDPHAAFHIETSKPPPKPPSGDPPRPSEPNGPKPAGPGPSGPSGPSGPGRK